MGIFGQSSAGCAYVTSSTNRETRHGYPGNFCSSIRMWSMQALRREREREKKHKSNWLGTGRGGRMWIYEQMKTPPFLLEVSPNLSKFVHIWNLATPEASCFKFVRPLSLLSKIVCHVSLPIVTSRWHFLTNGTRPRLEGHPVDSKTD